MHISPFAGLTVPDPDDPALSVDGGSFATRNPDLTDHFLRIGCVSHRHDAHLALDDPTIAPSATVIPSGGTIPSDTSVYLGYTVTDLYGGETRLSPVVNVTTPPSMAAPSAAPIVAFDPTGGVMPVGDFGYALTIMDSGGGETTVGPTTTVNRPPGYASGQMQLSGLAAFLVNPGDRWRLWRSDNGGNLNLIAVGTSDAFTDYGIDPVDHAATPPTGNSSTLSTNMIEFTLPPASGASGEAIFASGSAINVYMSTDGSFITPSLFGTYPMASAGATIDITGITVDPGAPPRISQSIPGAHQIDPDTELIDWHWKRPVGTAADLPASGNASGDVRVAEDAAVAYIWSDDAWQKWSGGGGGAALYDPTVTYKAGQYAIGGHAHDPGYSIYEFVAASGIGIDPATDDGSHWFELVRGDGMLDGVWAFASGVSVFGPVIRYHSTFNAYNVAIGGAAAPYIPDASGNVGASYRYTERGEVILRGTVTGGAVGDVIVQITDPTSSGRQVAPLSVHRYAVASNGGLGIIEVDIDGNVILVAGDPTQVDLDGVRYYTDE